MNYKCILAYGLTDQQLDKIRKRNLRVKEVTNDQALMNLRDILLGSNIDDVYSELPKDEKALIFSGYNNKELKETIAFIRKFVEGGVLAVVTDQSSKWTFKYLMEHLIEEREWFNSQK